MKYTYNDFENNLDLCNRIYFCNCYEKSNTQKRTFVKKRACVAIKLRIIKHTYYNYIEIIPLDNTTFSFYNSDFFDNIEECIKDFNSKIERQAVDFERKAEEIRLQKVKIDSDEYIKLEKKLKEKVKKV